MQLVEHSRRRREPARAGGVLALAILLLALYAAPLSRGFPAAQKAGQEHAADAANRKPPKKTSRKAALAKQSVDQALAANQELALRLQSKLPAGISVHDAAQGFTRLEDFVAAVEASANLDIHWVELKSLLTGPHPRRLADAIHTINPNVSGPYEGRRALKQAAELIKATEQQSEASVAAHR